MRFWELHGGGIGHSTRANFWQRKGGVIGGDENVAGDRQLQAATAADAVDGADDRLVEIAELLDTAETADTVVAVDRIAGRCGFQIPTGAEELLASAGNDRDSQVGVVAEAGEESRPSLGWWLGRSHLPWGGPG